MESHDNCSTENLLNVEIQLRQNDVYEVYDVFLSAVRVDFKCTKCDKKLLKLDDICVCPKAQQQCHCIEICCEPSKTVAPVLGEQENAKTV